MNNETDTSRSHALGSDPFWYGREVSKARNSDVARSVSSARKPALARAEIIDKVTRARFEAELDAALKRRPLNEAKLVGALRAIAPLSPSLRTTVADAVAVMVRRGSFTRELFTGSLRSLAESGDKHTTALLKGALLAEGAGGTATLSAACFSHDAALAQPLAKLAASRQSHLAFSAETARVVRSESNGAHLAALAPMIKESHRIALCVELFVPLARSAPEAGSRGLSQALAVLRGAERHLGRWLVLAEVATKAGDEGPANEAREKATLGPSSARAAWSLVSWALTRTAAERSNGTSSHAHSGANGSGVRDVEPPQTRPTVELVARLSDRPSADRDTTFLFRMASARAAVAKPMLEGLVKLVPSADADGRGRPTLGGPLGEEVAIRAALFLARDYGRADLAEALAEAASGYGAAPQSVRNGAPSTPITGKREELRGLAAAALFDVGLRDRAREIADELVTSKVIGNVAWSALIRARGPGSADDARANASPIVHETAFRWIQWGWLE
ncbi:MAG: hypothetical protein JWM74_183 [Myxococcaceae bacterium]|nr:hypothetical protein [Myxococcaceae bacterium]